MTSESTGGSGDNGVPERRSALSRLDFGALWIVALGAAIICCAAVPRDSLSSVLSHLPRSGAHDWGSFWPGLTGGLMTWGIGIAGIAVWWNMVHIADSEREKWADAIYNDWHLYVFHPLQSYMSAHIVANAILHHKLVSIHIAPSRRHRVERIDTDELLRTLGLMKHSFAVYYNEALHSNELSDDMLKSGKKQIAWCMKWVQNMMNIDTSDELSQWLNDKVGTKDVA